MKHLNLPRFLVSAAFILAASFASFGFAEDDAQPKKLKVLFLCTGNSNRSQMAEGWLRHLKGDIIEAYSAGVDPHGINPYAVKVMDEVGVDISGQKSEHINDYVDVPLDYVIAVCGNADDKRPDFKHGTKVIYFPFDDPPKLIQGVEDEEVRLNAYRRVRDEIKALVETFPETLEPLAIATKVAKLRKLTIAQPTGTPNSTCSGDVCSVDEQQPQQ